MSTSPRPTVPIRGPANLLGVVPFLLGYHPADSLILLGVRDAKVVLAARVDLPQPGADPASYGESVAHVTDVLARESSHAILIGYGTAEQATPVLHLTGQLLAQHRVQVLEALRVAAGRFHCTLCTNPACCPPEGTPYDPATPTAAHAMVAGLVALPSRDDLVASLAAHPDQQADLAAAIPAAAVALSTDVDAAHTRGGTATLTGWLRRRAAHALREATSRYRAGGTLDHHEAATLLLLLHHLPARDQALRHAEAADLPLWTDLTRRAPHDHVPAPATMLAYAALLHGNGALANVALDRALHADPGYTTARLLAAAIRAGIPPQLLHERLSAGPADDTD